MTNLNKKDIENLLPHREPMLLIDELYKILKNYHLQLQLLMLKKIVFLFKDIFQVNPVMPGVLIVESFGQAAAALNCIRY
jgi:3-hydroxyacyl-[acyl-carrier-protein] dehydratase